MNSLCCFPFRQLDNELFVTSQITTEQIKTIISCGIKTVICHRPDEEILYEATSFTPHNKELKAQLAKHNISLIYQPIRQISIEEANILAETLNNEIKPILIYCASGTRSTILWAISQISNKNCPKNEVISKAEKAGYSIAKYLP